MAALLAASSSLLSSTTPAAEPPSPPSASAILQELRAFRECGSVLYVAAHPDDENTQLIAYLAKERAMRVGYLSLTRGEGGQNLIGPEIGDPLGVIRTQELLAARRIDGGQQFFTRARDFGFSKSADQTLARWDRQAVLSDIVRVIRTFQPDIIITRFPLEPGGTHGHHTASTILALEAFKLAGDRNAFPEQLAPEPPAMASSITPDGYLSPWQPRRIFWNAFRGAGDRPTLHLDIGGYLPLLGESIGEIAARSRSSHRSQGYGSIGSRGSRQDDFVPLDGGPAGKDLFDGIDTTWNRWRSYESVPAKLDDIIAHFDPQNPSASVPALLALRRPTGPLGLFFHPPDKLHQLETLIQHCLGLYVETTVPQAEVIPGDTLNMHHAVVLRSAVPVRWRGISYPGLAREDETVELLPDRPVTRDTAQWLRTGSDPGAVGLGQPYWLRADGTPGMYHVDKPSSIGQPENPPVFPVAQVFEVSGQILTVTVDPVQITADPAKGEIRRRLEVVAPVSLFPTRDVALFTPGSSHPIDIDIRACRDHQSGTLALAMPPGWTVSPTSIPFSLSSTGDHARFTFTVTAPATLTSTTATLTARATIGDHTYDTTRQEIRYEHIPPQLLQPPARIKALCLDLQTRGHEIGYLPGAGDLTAEAATAMGYHVTPLTGTDLTPGRLRAFDAILIGVRAFNVRPDLTPSALSSLFAYVENGGTVVEQYNTPNELRTPRLAPYDLTLDRNLPAHRVTNENAPITFLLPSHPALNTPNKITPADFDGWTQERGLNFPSAWDQQHWTPLLACSDPGEPPLTSGLLIADHGKGHFVYTGLSFFRQLPAGVPGAYRLFANLLSLSGQAAPPPVVN